MLILLLGSNLGDRKSHLLKARDMIESRIGPIVKISAIYETESWGIPGQPDFLNQALIIETGHAPEELLKRTQAIEKKMGRLHSGIRYVSRIIDIDILFYGRLILSTPDLVIPHPQVELRRFALVPLVEMVPYFMHPSTGKNMKQLLEECNDPLFVKKYL